MDVPTTTGKTEAQAKGGRRSTRLNIAIPIAISGKDSDGLSFKENTRTAVINKHGARILTLHQMTLGDEVVIENRALGVSAKAKVVWLGKRRSPQDSVEVGIQLAEDKNIWGIAFPPEDWQEGSPVGTRGEKLEKDAATPGSKPVPGGPPAKAASAPAPTPAKTEVAPKTVPSTLPPIAQLTALMKGSLESFTSQAEAVAEGHTRLFQEQLSGLVRQVGTQAQVSLQESAAQLQDQATRALEAKLQPIEERLLSSRKEIEAQLSQLSDLQKTGQEELEKARRNIQEASWQALESASEQLTEKVQAELETITTEFATEARSRIQKEATSAVESFGAQARERLSALTEEHLAKSVSELQARQSETIEETRARMVQAANDAVTNFQGNIRQANEDAAPALRVEIQKWVAKELESARETLVAHAREQMQDDSAAAAEGALRETGERLKKLTEEYVAQSQPELAARFEEQSEQAKAHFTQTIQSAIAGGLDGLKAQSESLVSDFEDRLQESRDKEVQEASEHLHKAADNLKGLIAKEFHKQGLEAGKALKDELKASWKGLAEDARKQLLNLTTHTAESMNAEAGAGLDEFRHQLQKTVKNLQEKSAEELEDQLQNLGKRKREELIHGLQRDAEESGEQATAQVKSAIEKAVQEASDTVDKHVGSGAVFLKQLEDQARVQLETHAQKIEEAGRSSAAAFSTQPEGLAGSGLDKLGQELEALLDRYRKELEEVTKTHQNKAMEEVQSKLQYVTERLTEDSAAQLTTLTKENLEMAVFKLQESKDNVVNEAEEAFRAKIAEVIAPALKPSGRKSKPKESPEPEKGRNKG